jgi:hypothetical protein
MRNDVDATRARVGSVLEWVLAAAGIVAVLAIGSIVAREFRTVSAVMPVSAREAAVPDTPASIPSRVVSVPMLLLSDGTQLRVGDSASQLESHLGPRSQVGLASVDRTPAGERVTRFYEEGGTRFVVVLEAIGDAGDARVTAIYLR